MLDYIIVGQGITGSCFALKLLKENHSFLVLNQYNENAASNVAAGMYNAVVLKRFVKIWQAEEQLIQLEKTFGEFEQILGKNYNHQLPIKRIFHNQDEVETWKKKTEDLKEFLLSDIQKNTNENIKAEFGFGEVKKGGKIKLKELLDDFRDFLIKKNLYKEEDFIYDEFIHKPEYVQYKNIKAKRIVFCEGYKIKQNPYFNWLPVIGNKGNVLDVKVDQKLEQSIFKSKVFLMPKNQVGTFYVGSTYERDFEHENPTEKAKETLLNGLESFLNSDYKILNHKAGIRPTLQDRRPIVGQHPELKNVILCNGMGTRGTLLAPTMVEFLFEYLENNKELPEEINLNRFKK